MAAKLTHAEQKLNALAAITLTLTPMKLLPPWRNIPSNAHCVSAGRAAWADCSPTKTSGAVNGPIQNVTLEQTQRNAALNEMRSVIKKRRSNLPM